MTLKDTPLTLEQHIRRRLEQTAINLLLAVRIGEPNTKIKELTEQISAMGAALT